MDGLPPWLGDVLAVLEEFYWAPGGPGEKSREQLRGLAAGPWKPALAMFYHHYAYERAGAPRDWGPTAAEVIAEYDKPEPEPDLPGWAWSRFRESIGQTNKPNQKNNPLWDGHAAQHAATAFVAELKAEDYNLIRWAARRLAKGEAVEVSRQLQSLHALGPKISAFFLRDVVSSHGIPEGSIGGRHCIQPIDTWIRRAVATLSARPVLADEGRDLETQGVAVELADALGITSAAFNTGLWVLGAGFARSESRLSAALRSRDLLYDLVRRELDRAEKRLVALRKVEAAVGRSDGNPDQP
jgi:hypothetical protein